MASFPPFQGRKCYLCVRYNVLPMSQAAQFAAKNLLDIVFLEDTIRREQNQLFRVRLSNQHPVERVSMMWRQPSSFDRVH